MTDKTIRLPGLGDVSQDSTDDAFQQVADEVNLALASFIAAKLQDLLDRGELPEGSDDAGPTIVACLAAMINCAGRLCASFEPSLDGDVMASIVQDQFNAGRDDHKIRHGGATMQ